MNLVEIYNKTSVITDRNGSVLAEATSPFRLVPSDTYHMGCTNVSEKPRQVQLQIVRFKQMLLRPADLWGGLLLHIVMERDGTATVKFK